MNFKPSLDTLSEISRAVQEANNAHFVAASARYRPDIGDEGARHRERLAMQAQDDLVEAIRDLRSDRDAWQYAAEKADQLVQDHRNRALSLQKKLDDAYDQLEKAKQFRDFSGKWEAYCNRHNADPGTISFNALDLVTKDEWGVIQRHIALCRDYGLPGTAPNKDLVGKIAQAEQAKYTSQIYVSPRRSGKTAAQRAAKWDALCATYQHPASASPGTLAEAIQQAGIDREDQSKEDPEEYVPVQPGDQFGVFSEFRWEHSNGTIIIGQFTGNAEGDPEGFWAEAEVRGYGTTWIPLHNKNTTLYIPRKNITKENQ